MERYSGNECRADELKRAESEASTVLAADPRQGIGYIAARPRMALYIEYNARIYEVYLNFSRRKTKMDATSYWDEMIMVLVAEQTANKERCMENEND
ncbi:MAG: hypothetical protein IJU65_06620 [Desulfovibrio sp.]|nr:hypothetical protein [Desulfovibrio sp.]